MRGIAGPEHLPAKEAYAGHIGRLHPEVPIPAGLVLRVGQGNAEERIDRIHLAVKQKLDGLREPRIQDELITLQVIEPCGPHGRHRVRFMRHIA